MKRLLCVALALWWMAAASAAEIEWAGTGWQVRSGAGKPCASDRWNGRGAWVDAEGRLHLRLSRMPDGHFACVEVESVKRFGFGRYAFEIRGPIGDADPDVVFGVFMYPPADVGPDGTNEIDIEIARWGDACAPQINYTVWNRSHPGSRHTVLRVPDDIAQSTFAFTWQPGVVSWESPLQHGRGVVVRGGVADRPQKLIINLWLYRRPEPRSGKEVEFVIKSLGPL
ncbi:glycoside hydrolase family 16 protein [Paraburkholderia terrae]|uniref:glycoside hydrolase family 16 protein n=1 Tax=Paraburkholderia terrae TaxID=311230 RepID=UPI001EE1BAA9|nr:glycoside hydrolase family 16 protein [Paraburkholderia terrae]GJH02736.1 family 16 glycosylhydrolase [Paraburkholderia terrae]